MNKTADSILKSSRLILEEGAMNDKNIFAEGGEMESCFFPIQNL